MIRWILLKLVGIFLPSLISKAVRPTSKKNSSNPLNIEFKVLDKELGDKIPFPSFKEQSKIANFLSSIDNKIEQIEKQLDETKQFKKALLQQMFV